jgi:fluoroquinolone transport system permease protein
MKRFLLLSRNDFRMIFRDPMLKTLLFVPALIIVAVIIFVPTLNARFPAFQAYNYIVLMGAGIQTATMFGFITGFIFLEEKDEHVFMALKTMPVSGSFFVLARLSLAVLIATVYNWGLLHFGTLLDIKWWHEIALAVQFSFLAPLLALAVAVFASNKVEGLAQFKIYNLLVTLPLIIYFLDFKALHILGLLPSYWTFRSIEMLENEGSFWLFHVVGWIVYWTLIIMLVKRFEKKVF